MSIKDEVTRERRDECCAMLDQMKEMVNDENQGIQAYSKMYRTLDSVTQGHHDPVTNLFQSLVFDMAEDEKRHKHHLEIMLEVIGDFCKCE